MDRVRSVDRYALLAEVVTLADPVVLYEGDDNVGIIALNRPDKLNAISHELQQALTEAFVRADADPATSVVMLRAEGRSFCAGYDIGAKGPDADDWRSDSTKAHAHLQPQLAFEMAPWLMKKPVIASVQGHVLGGGLRARHAVRSDGSRRQRDFRRTGSTFFSGRPRYRDAADR
jgi:enoyl-CoA hydratase/carnithine racemase